jgi:hypothetical protein
MTIKFNLGETAYEVPDRMTIGQLESLADALAAGGKAFRILEIAMMRAQPKVDNVRDVEATVPEITVAVDAILVSAGFRAQKADQSGEG